MKKKAFKKNRNSFLDNFFMAWKFVVDSKSYIYYIILIFFGLSLAGFFLPVPILLEQKILALIEEIIKQSENLYGFDLWKFIFFNNLQTSFIGLFTGVFFGIVSIVFAVFNGYLLGFVMNKAIEIGGVGVAWRLIPHGVFELPAVFISLGLGLKLGLSFFNSKKIKDWKKYLYEFVRVFVFIILPLLFIAAIIETLLITLLN